MQIFDNYSVHIFRFVWSTCWQHDRTPQLYLHIFILTESFLKYKECDECLRKYLPTCVWGPDIVQPFTRIEDHTLNVERDCSSNCLNRSSPDLADAHSRPAEDSCLSVLSAKLALTATYGLERLGSIWFLVCRNMLSFTFSTWQWTIMLIDHSQIYLP